MKTIEELEHILSEPSDKIADDLRQLDGDILILGVGGKMGPTLAWMAKRASDRSGVQRKVMAASRFSSGTLQQQLEQQGIETCKADLLNKDDIAKLPEAKNIIYMAGNKFGTVGNEHFSWAMNTFVPVLVAKRYRQSRIVAFSTGNVYPLTPLIKGGATEKDPTDPIGEYAQSCLGRERIFEHFSRKYDIPMVHFRLNYAIDMRYGILLEIAQMVMGEKPIQLDTGHVNVIWQGDANEYALRCLTVCDTPPRILNASGPETVSIRWLAEEFGALFAKEPVLIGAEKDTALLSNSSEIHRLFGYPQVPLRQMIEWTADWVKSGGETSNKPTHFQERAGRF
ncbi:NAD(P)-dependent oxidoreductase [Bacillaceae bacterium SIJ1]|uniref:NAD-dependent epimerase/dehydratase family protein n=1 Tax=Litoribacterium kuwaitense TaxID=1398745 RepID=UPI0013EC5B66|nr:NAD-dependent epimerase/dehydratase family protein [Litoribacterium kuwaitense]NGP46746.1 NAD(P)-dependent oxidoreductase [Litoribacterium kuwaitense]